MINLFTSQSFLLSDIISTSSRKRRIIVYGFRSLVTVREPATSANGLKENAENCTVNDSILSNLTSHERSNCPPVDKQHVDLEVIRFVRQPTAA